MKRIVSVISLFIALIMLAACITPAFADGSVDITDEFTDTAFRHEVLSALGKDHNGRISDKEAAELKSLSIEKYCPVSDFSGIGYLTGLEKLDVRSSCSVIDITGLPLLKEVSLFGCSSLLSVRLTNLPSLKVAFIECNPSLTSVELYSLPLLKGAIIVSNPSLTSVELYSLPSLTALDCEDNSLRWLDLTECPAIENLILDGNKFASAYSIRVPEGKSYLIEDSDYRKNAKYVPGVLLFSLDTENESVREMNLCHVYCLDPEAVKNSGRYNSRAVIGSVSDLSDLLGISFPFSWAELLNAHFDADGKLIPGKEGNSIFSITLMNVTDEDALCELSWNPYIKYVERDYVAEYEPWFEYRFPFFDVSCSAWYYDSVKYVFDRSFMRGTSDKFFSPEIPLTRAMVVTILNRMAGPVRIPGACSFTDVPAGEWYSDAVGWAEAMEIVKGVGDGKFAPDARVTRADFATMLYRFGNAVYFEWKESGDNNVSPPDSGSVPEYAVTAVGSLFGSGILNGRENGVFDPFSPVTRAEAAAMVERIIKYGESQGIVSLKQSCTIKKCRDSKDEETVICAAHSPADVSEFVAAHGEDFEAAFAENLTLADVLAMYDDKNL